MPDRFLLDLLGTALPLVVGGFLAGLFTYWFERRRTRLERGERRAVLLESLRRELAFVPEQLPAYRAGAVHLLPPIRTVVGGQLLDGQVLDWRTDAQLIQPLLEFLGVASIYNDLVAAVNAAQAGQAWSEDMRQHWHGQLLGAHTSVLSTQRALLARLSTTYRAPGRVLRNATTTTESQFGPPPAAGDGWRVDLAHSRVGFSAKHMGIITVHGQFTSAEVQLNLDGLDLTRSSVQARIEASSVSTGVELRDADLRSDHFLDVAVFPSIVFASNAIERVADNRFRIDGNLTIRDVTRGTSLELLSTDPVADGRGGLRRGFTATGRIDRTEWGLTWNTSLDTGGWLVSEEVELQLDVAVFGPAD
jgi:polyisoprenoid-binding protein YceI